MKYAVRSACVLLAVLDVRLVVQNVLLVVLDVLDVTVVVSDEMVVVLVVVYLPLWLM